MADVLILYYFSRDGDTVLQTFKELKKALIRRYMQFGRYTDENWAFMLNWIGWTGNMMNWKESQTIKGP